VERNRLFVVAKNFPASAMIRAPFASLARYLWHAYYMLRGRGSAGQYRRGGAGLMLVWFVLKAHLALFARYRALMAKRRAVQSLARLTAAEFQALLRQHSISPRQVASL
jgi:hypothetical protein